MLLVALGGVFGVAAATVAPAAGFAMFWATRMAPGAADDLVSETLMTGA
jgi:hypothetical protein